MPATPQNRADPNAKTDMRQRRAIMRLARLFSSGQLAGAGLSYDAAAGELSVNVASPITIVGDAVTLPALGEFEWTFLALSAAHAF